MTTIQIELPDPLAREASAAGLLTPTKLEQILREQLREQRIAGLDAIRATLDADPLPPMTPGEIQAEIDAWRADQRSAAGR